MENKFGEYLKSLRLERGLSLKDVEAQTKISATYIYRLESGTRKNPSAFTIKALSKFYNVRQEKLLTLATSNGYNADNIKSNDISSILGDKQVQDIISQLLSRIRILL